MKNSINTKQYFLTLNITYYMQAFAVVAFSAIVALLLFVNKTEPSGDNNTWVYLVSIVLIAGLVMGFFVFRFLLKRIKQEMRLQDKMPRYARALLVRSSLIEIPGLLAAIAAFITANLNFLVISLLVFVVFIALRPTKARIAEDLLLSPKDKAMLEDDRAVISETHR